MIKPIQHITPPILQELNQLLTACKKLDSNILPIYPDLITHFRPLPPSLLCYKKGTLIGFAAAFYFEHDCAELTLFVHPKHRHKKFGQALLRTMLEQIQLHRPVPQIVFSAPHKLLERQLIASKFSFSSTEYLMTLNLAKYTPYPTQHAHIRLATTADINDLLNIETQCFPNPLSGDVDRMMMMLAKPQSNIYLLEKDNQLIGKAHITRENFDAKLSDIGVLPAYQNQGFGKVLIHHCISTFLAYHPLNQQHVSISLSVETHNQHALNLYQKIGFEVTNAVDYWKSSFIHLLQLTK